MACNTPIIASFDMNSELAKILNDSKTGICVPPGDIKKLEEAIEELSTKESLLHEFSQGREYVVKNASKYSCTEKTIAVLKDVYQKKLCSGGNI